MLRCATLILWAGLWTLVEGKFAPKEQLSFGFDYNRVGENPPALITSQCETINLKWDRRAQPGINPVAPYTLKVFTSSHIVPFEIPAGDGLSFDWQVPFAPRTMYQICMFASNGASGGCQDQYTVVPSLNAPTCGNVTFPRLLEGVVAKEAHNGGAMSMFGFVPQCTDLQFTPPANATPPFTLTVAPALLPPWIIKSNTMETISWTVALTPSHPFYIGITDKTGASFSQGPLHSGAGNDVSCLSATSNSPLAKSSTAAVAAGASIGGLVGGALLGVLAMWLFLRSREGHVYGGGEFKQVVEVKSTPNELEQGGLHSNRAPAGRGSEHQLVQDHTVNPFVLGPSEETSPSPSAIDPIPPPFSTSMARLSSNSTPQNIYVVHHDAGRAPISVYTSDGSQVVELPPRYNGEERDKGQSLPAPPLGRRPSGLPARPNPTRARSTSASSPASARRTLPSPGDLVRSPPTLMGHLDSFEEERQPEELPSKPLQFAR